MKLLIKLEQWMLIVYEGMLSGGSKNALKQESVSITEEKAQRGLVYQWGSTSNPKPYSNDTK